MTKQKDTRSRAWTFVAYPDSVPDKWIDIIEDYHLEWALSPLHNADTDPNGEVKKAHWHVLLQFTNVKSYEQILEITQKVNATVPIKVHNTRSLVRYFCHLDNPDKFQYKISDIKSFGGLDVEDLMKPSASEMYDIIGDIRQWIVDSEIYEFEDVMNYSYEEHPNDWVPVLITHSTVIWRFVQSRRYRREKEGIIHG